MDLPDTPFSLAGKVIAVTGGSGLIGWHLVKKLPFYGAQVVVGVRRHNELAERLKQESFDGAARVPLALHLDIAKPESIKKFFDQVRDKFGSLDGLVNNAWPRTTDWGAKFEDVPPPVLVQEPLRSRRGLFFVLPRGGNLTKG